MVSSLVKDPAEKRHSKRLSFPLYSCPICTSASQTTIWKRLWGGKEGPEAKRSVAPSRGIHARGVWDAGPEPRPKGAGDQWISLRPLGGPKTGSHVTRRWIQRGNSKTEQTPFLVVKARREVYLLSHAPAGEVCALLSILSFSKAASLILSSIQAKRPLALNLGQNWFSFPNVLFQGHCAPKLVLESARSKQRFPFDWRLLANRRQKFIWTGTFQPKVHPTTCKSLHFFTSFFGLLMKENRVLSCVFQAFFFLSFTFILLPPKALIKKDSLLIGPNGLFRRFGNTIRLVPPSCPFQCQPSKAIDQPRRRRSRDDCFSSSWQRGGRHF